MQNINSFKLSVTSIITAISSLLGWFGWLIVIFIACMFVDLVTGSAAAIKYGEWQSKKSREGLWHKSGAIAAIICALLFDLLIGLVINNIPAIKLPFNYSVLISTLVIIWYTLTEMGSIIENSGKLGAPIPMFLQKAIISFKGGIEIIGDKTTNGSK